MKKKITLIIVLVLILAVSVAFIVRGREQGEAPESISSTEDTEPVMLASKPEPTPTPKVEVEPYGQEELESLFQQAYENIHTDPIKLKEALMSPSSTSSNLDEQYIAIELDELLNIADTSKLPSDYTDQYRTWREAYIAAMLQRAEYISNLFEEVREEVYTLNKTTPYSTFDEDTLEIKDAADPIKKGTQLIRTGKGTKELESWSRCLLPNGKTVYIVTIDLTTENPVVAAGGGNSGGGTGGSGAGGSGTTQQQQPSSPSGSVYDSSGAIVNPALDPNYVPIESPGTGELTDDPNITAKDYEGIIVA